MKITQYNTANSFDSGDVLIKDGTNGTKIITVEKALEAFIGMIGGSKTRANIYRGKNLGTSVTNDQKTAIQNGTFTDMYIGDYWVINGTTWRIADMDYFYQVGDTAFTSHHLVIVPNGKMYDAKMNDTNTTEGGYVGSKMYTENLEQAKTTITAAFGSMVKTHRDYLTNAVTDGKPSGGAWVDSQVELMNEIMVYGCHIKAAMGNGTSISNSTTAKKQLALFRLNPAMLNKRETIWLRDVVSSPSFALVAGAGAAADSFAAGSYGVRPYFVIG